MRILINGQEFTKEEMNVWKKKRIKIVLHQLHKQMPMSEDVDEMAKSLTQIKINMSYDEILSLLKFKLRIGTIGMKLAAVLSRGKRKSCITTIYADGINVEVLGKIINCLMMEDNDAYRKVNLGACPDHYVLLAHDNTLEVIETTGNAPVPTQFFITFHDETGLKEPRDESYPYQSTGIAKLKDGTIIGGVRHQFKNTKTGIEARTLVEFPSMCPRTIINEHQKHLAVEWSAWITWAIEHQ